MDYRDEVVVGQPNHGRLHAHVCAHGRRFTKRECRTDIRRNGQAPLLEGLVESADALEQLGLRLAMGHGRIEGVVCAGLKLRETEIPGVHGDSVVAETWNDRALDVTALHHRVVRRQRKIAVQV